MRRKVGFLPFAWRDDPENLAAAGEAAFGDRLTGRRRRASIEWRWLCGPGRTP